MWYNFNSAVATSTPSTPSAAAAAAAAAVVDAKLMLVIIYPNQLHDEPIDCNQAGFKAKID